MPGRVAPLSNSEPGADRRAHPRVAVAMPAFLDVGGTRHHVQIVDISAGGAKLDCAVTVASGTGVTLDCGSLCCKAVARWQGGGSLGICFDEPLDERITAALVNRSNALAARIAAAG